MSRLIGLRGEYLLRGIRSLVDDGSAFKLPWGDLFRRRSSSPAPRSDESETPVVTKLLGQPIVARSGDKGTLPEHAGNAKLSVSARRALPSYVSGRSFARGLLGVLVPDQSGTDVMHQITSSVDALPEGGLKQQLTLS